MSEPPADLAASYLSTLEKYVETGEEHQLEEAYALGRAAFAGGVTLLSLLDLHRTSVETLLRRTPEDPTAAGQAAADRRIDATFDATFQMLAEALATFEMAQRGFWEAQERARWASMLQRELLPTSVPDVPGLDLALRYLPGEPGSHAGGDWYDVFEIEDGRVGLVVGDITGHGVRAAAAMGQLRIAVLAYALAGYEPRAAIEHVDLLIERMGTGIIATLVYALVDVSACELTLVNAGHPPPIVVAGGVSRRLLEGHTRLLGLSPPLTDRDQRLVELRTDSHVLLYTDGLLEPVERGGGDGVARLQDVTEGFAGTADDLCDLVLAELAPDGAEDDICILAATLLP